MNTNNGWLDIASAPKDGSRVLLWNRHFDAPCSGQFYGFGDWRMDGNLPLFVYQPTHWMPLPAAPGSPTEQPAYTVTVDPDPRGVSVGVYLGSRCVDHGAHPIPAGSGPERDWELSCDACNGSGHVFVERQVAERKTDVQEFKEDCECCEGRGFTIAFEDIPGIAEYVKSCCPASTVADEGAKEYGSPARILRQFLTADGFIAECDIPEICARLRPDAPAAGDALDAARYRWLRDQDATDGIAIVMKNKHFKDGLSCAENIDSFIDAALSASQQGGE